MAPRPERRHHIGDDDIKCLIIAGIHEEVCGGATGAQAGFLLTPSSLVPPSPLMHG